MKVDSLILDLGCGYNKQVGAFGVDIEPNDNVDSQMDLSVFPWKLPDDQFAVVYLIQSLEHLENGVKVMQEVYRVCRHGALVYVKTPNGYCPGFAQDPTHKKAWNLGAFLYFCPTQWPHDWHKPYHGFFGCNFRIIHYHSTGDRAGRTPWGDTVYADNLTVIMQAIKESNAPDVDK